MKQRIKQMGKSPIHSASVNPHCDEIQHDTSRELLEECKMAGRSKRVMGWIIVYRVLLVIQIKKDNLIYTQKLFLVVQVKLIAVNHTLIAQS